MSLLTVKDLQVHYPGNENAVVENLSFSIDKGECLGLVGESGSGKTQTALAIMGLLPMHARIGGSVTLQQTELLGANTTTLNKVRAQRIAMIFQDPQAALNPYVRIGSQLRRILLEHKICVPKEATQRVLAMLHRVGLPDPDRQYQVFPHQLSGGMRQRVMIGAALLAAPDLLIADEPTTALDVTVQAQILTLLKTIRDETDAALLLITHDLGVVAGHCDRLLVMDSGRAVEAGGTTAMFASPVSEKLQALLAVAPRIDRDAPPAQTGDDIVLNIKGLSVAYKERRLSGRKELQAVYPTDISLREGETLAIVGESGSGKTSLARALVGLIPTSGIVSFLGEQLAASVGARTSHQHRNLQMIFQDPLASLNPAMRILDIVAEPVLVHGEDTDAKNVATAMLERVGIGKDFLRRFPHELSGGQAQRVAIARALILKPAILICDEAVAALDGTVQEEILQLLKAEQRASGVSIVFITHDLAVVRQLGHRIAVMYMGRLCELADNAALFSRPRHPYTKALLDAVPVPDPTIESTAHPLIGEVGSILSPPSGCSFHPRCEQATAICSSRLPEFQKVPTGTVACHRADELDLSY